MECNRGKGRRRGPGESWGSEDGAAGILGPRLQPLPSKEGGRQGTHPVYQWHRSLC